MHLQCQNAVKKYIIMYKGKKRRHSRYWWRRIRSRKYRRLLIVQTVLLVIATAVMYLLSSQSNGRNGIYLLAWCLIVGTILISSIIIFRRKDSQEELPQTQYVSVILSKSQEFDTDCGQTKETSAFPVEEIPSKSDKNYDRSVNSDSLLEK